MESHCTVFHYSTCRKSVLSQISLIDRVLPTVCKKSSRGISSTNRGYDERRLAITVDDKKSKYSGDDVLAEKFLPGREFTVRILGTGEGQRRLERSA